MSHIACSFAYPHTAQSHKDEGAAVPVAVAEGEEGAPQPLPSARGLRTPHGGGGKADSKEEGRDEPAARPPDPAPFMADARA
jgi:hypothetical protein